MEINDITYKIYQLNEVWLSSIPNQVLLISLLLVFSLTIYLFYKNRQLSSYGLMGKKQFYYLNSITQDTNLAYLIVDSKNIIRFVNDKFLDQYSITKEQVSNISLNDLKIDAEIIDFLLANDEGSYRLNGNKQDIESLISVNPISTNEGEELGKLVTIDRHAATLINKKDDLSHDLNTPLNAILGYSEVLVSDSTLSEDQKKVFKTIHEQSLLLKKRIVDKISDLDDTGFKTPVSSVAPQVNHILVVDDVSINRTLLKLILDKRGYTITEAVNGKDAIEKFNEEKPDLILMDIRMPVMDGIEAVRILRENQSNRSLPIIAVTASSTIKTKSLVEDNGFNALLKKPFKEDELISIIQKFSRP